MVGLPKKPSRGDVPRAWMHKSWLRSGTVYHDQYEHGHAWRIVNDKDSSSLFSWSIGDHGLMLDTCQYLFVVIVEQE